MDIGAVYGRVKDVFASAILPKFKLTDTTQALLDQVLSDFDHKRYGMSFEEFSSYVENEELQVGFQERFGISYTEYLARWFNGENMGTALVDGKFQPLPEEN